MRPGLAGDESGATPGEGAASAAPPELAPPDPSETATPTRSTVAPHTPTPAEASPLAENTRKPGPATPSAAPTPAALAEATRPVALTEAAPPTTPPEDTRPVAVDGRPDPVAVYRVAEPGAVSRGAEPVAVGRGAAPGAVGRGAESGLLAEGVQGLGVSPVEARPAAGPRRIEGLLLGLAAGDAAGWPAARHRAARMPEWTRRLTRELDTFAEQNATTTLPVPIALNQPPEPLRLGPSDDAEWAAFAAEAVLRAGETTALGDLSLERRMRASIDLSWNAVASEVAAAADRAPEVESALLPLRARISVRAGLGNLATGLRPPATGHDNPHYFDDAACVRACVLAVAHPGDPRLAAELAEFDARYTQDGDGVHGARAMAAAVALALAGHHVDTCVEAALAELPAATEIGRNARHALALAQGSESTFALVPLLEHQIVDHVYSYGIAAAETVPVALALAAAARGRIAEAVPAAACLSRVADSAPALAGALTGALGGAAAIPSSWRDACRTLSGCALPRLTGTDLIGLAELLEATGLADPLDSPELATPEG
ncbi:ADP-ribosylglycohydrolase family protein [Streptomyces sp. NPDC005251]|uniref:ADP-ribosylglycohydrolase family protein n=1 Tax=unclassified Streptomyces TaxID=2593676 RepID=UPI0033B20544